MKTVSYKGNYCLIRVGEYEFSVSKIIGEQIDRMNNKIRQLKQELKEKGQCSGCAHG